MTDLDAERLFRTLDTHRVRYVLIGGLAAVMHGSPLATFDVDITPDTEPGNLRRLSDALRAAHARLRTSTEEVSFDPHPALLEQMTTLTLMTDAGALDISTAPDGVGGYSAWAENATPVDVYGITVAVAALDDIIRSKEAADRDKDRAALPILRALREEIHRDGQAAGR